MSRVLRPTLSVSRALAERAHGCRRAEVGLSRQPKNNTSRSTKSTGLHTIATMAQASDQRRVTRQLRLLQTDAARCWCNERKAKSKIIAARITTHARAAPLSTSDATPCAVHRNHACCNDAAQSHKEDAKNCTDAARPDAARVAPPTAARVERTTTATARRTRAQITKTPHRVTTASRTFRSPTSVAARSSSPSTRCPAS